jgi:hypothetical protein
MSKYIVSTTHNKVMYPLYFMDAFIVIRSFLCIVYGMYLPLVREEGDIV